MGFEPVINWLQDYRLSLHGYPGNDEKVVNFNDFQSFSVGQIIWQATAIVDG